jgi:hypothetical protein
MIDIFMKKRGVVADYLPWILIAVAVIVIFAIFASGLKKDGSSLIGSIKNFIMRG